MTDQYIRVLYILISPVKITLSFIFSLLFYQSVSLRLQSCPYHMKAINNKQPLCCLLQNSHLVTSLPFIDNQYTNIPNTKIQYLIKQEQNKVGLEPHKYLEGLNLQNTQFADSLEFQMLAEQVQTKIKAQTQNPEKKSMNVLAEPPKKYVSKENQSTKQLLHSSIVIMENNQYKNINLELSQKLGPIAMKELIQSIDKEKQNLQQEIEKEKQAIELLNQKRKYQQSEAYEREKTIEDRVKVMLYKRRKVE